MPYTQSDYELERAICDKANAYAEQFRQKNGWIVIPAEAAAHPDYSACSNEMRSRVERYEIFRDLPQKLVAYLSSDCANVTTWTGDHLGTVSIGAQYRSNMGDMRYPFRTVINGTAYSGIGYGGGGMHCRLRRVA